MGKDIRDVIHQKFTAFARRYRLPFSLDAITPETPSRPGPDGRPRTLDPVEGKLLLAYETTKDPLQLLTWTYSEVMPWPYLTASIEPGRSHISKVVNINNALEGLMGFIVNDLARPDVDRACGLLPAESMAFSQRPDDQRLWVEHGIKVEHGLLHYRLGDPYLCQNRTPHARNHLSSLLVETWSQREWASPSEIADHLLPLAQRATQHYEKTKILSKILADYLSSQGLEFRPLPNFDLISSFAHLHLQEFEADKPYRSIRRSSSRGALLDTPDSQQKEARLDETLKHFHLPTTQLRDISPTPLLMETDIDLG